MDAWCEQVMAYAKDKAACKEGTERDGDDAKHEAVAMG